MIPASRRGERGEEREGKERKGRGGESECMTDAPRLALCPLSTGAARPFAEEEGGKTREDERGMRDAGGRGGAGSESASVEKAAERWEG